MRRLCSVPSVALATPLLTRWQSSHSVVEPTKDGAAAASSGSSDSKASESTNASVRPPPPGVTLEQNNAAREALIQEIISRDKEIFELKRQHELSMLRVEQQQKRVLKDQEDRGMYYEQNSNVHTFDTISVGLYTQRNTLYHAMGAERLRNFKIFLTVFTTIVICTYLYYRYMVNEDWEYVRRPLKMLGSRVSTVREIYWEKMSDEERFNALTEKSTHGEGGGGGGEE